LQVLLLQKTNIGRGALRHLLEQRDVQVVAEARDASEALEQAGRLKPQVALLDLDMPLDEARNLIGRISEVSSRTRQVAMCGTSDRGRALAIIDAGVLAYVLKLDPFEQLMEAAESALRGEVYLSAKVAAADDAAEADEHEGTPSIAMLSGREREVLQLLADGHSSKKIASSMGLSLKTIESHRLHISSKLGIRSIAALTKLALQEGLIRLDP